LTQALRGSESRDKDRDSNDERAPNAEKGWLPDALDRFMNR
jgi:hypothetical protein